MYDKDILDHLVKLHIEQGRTIASLHEEYGIGYNTIGRAVARFRKEAEENAEKEKILSDMEDYRRLKIEVEELRKENDFLKKAAAFFAKDKL